MFGSEAGLGGRDGDVKGDAVYNQPFKDIEGDAKKGYWSVGGWFCWGFGWIQDWYYLAQFQDIGDGVTLDRQVEDIGQGPDGYRPELFQVHV